MQNYAEFHYRCTYIYKHIRRGHRVSLMKTTSNWNAFKIIWFTVFDCISRSFEWQQTEYFKVKPLWIACAMKGNVSKVDVPCGSEWKCEKRCCKEGLALRSRVTDLSGRCHKLSVFLLSAHPVCPCSDDSDRKGVSFITQSSGVKSAVFKTI